MYGGNYTGVIQGYSLTHPVEFASFAILQGTIGVYVFNTAGYGLT